MFSFVDRSWSVRSLPHLSCCLSLSKKNQQILEITPCAYGQPHSQCEAGGNTGQTMSMASFFTYDSSLDFVISSHSASASEVDQDGAQDALKEEETVDDMDACSHED